jgi:hypothetical protein
VPVAGGATCTAVQAAGRAVWLGVLLVICCHLLGCCGCCCQPASLLNCVKLPPIFAILQHGARCAMRWDNPTRIPCNRPLTRSVCCLHLPG